MSSFNGVTPLVDMFAAVDRLRALPGSGDDLVNLLPEQSPIYRGRPTGDAERLRGYVLASFEQTGLPEFAMAFVLEELESGHTPYLIAAAAKAARGAQTVPAHIVPLLLDAIERVRQSDDVVCFDRTGLTGNDADADDGTDGIVPYAGLAGSARAYRCHFAQGALGTPATGLFRRRARRCRKSLRGRITHGSTGCAVVLL